MTVFKNCRRLHNKADLMAELQKILRVLKKLDPTTPHDVLLVLDATTGQRTPTPRSRRSRNWSP